MEPFDFTLPPMPDTGERDYYKRNPAFEDWKHVVRVKAAACADWMFDRLNLSDYEPLERCYKVAVLMDRGNPRKVFGAPDEHSCLEDAQYKLWRRLQKDWEIDFAQRIRDQPTPLDKALFVHTEMKAMQVEAERLYGDRGANLYDSTDRADRTHLHLLHMEALKHLLHWLDFLSDAQAFGMRLFMENATGDGAPAGRVELKAEAPVEMDRAQAWRHLARAADVLARYPDVATLAEFDAAVKEDRDRLGLKGAEDGEGEAVRKGVQRLYRKLSGELYIPEHLTGLDGFRKIVADLVSGRVR